MYIGAGGEGGISGESLGYIVVGAIYVVIFLQVDKGTSAAWFRHSTPAQGSAETAVQLG